MQWLQEKWSAMESCLPLWLSRWEGVTVFRFLHNLQKPIRPGTAVYVEDRGSKDVQQVVNVV